jgi:hypothetical protein
MYDRGESGGEGDIDQATRDLWLFTQEVSAFYKQNLKDPLRWWKECSIEQGN